MKLIGKFKYENTEFVILEDFGKFKIGKKILDKIYFDFSDTEKDLIKLVIHKLMPTKDLIKLKPVSVNGNKYDLYYNPSRGIYTYYPEPIESDLKVLNIRYNNQSDAVYDDIRSLKDNKNIIKRIINVGKKMVVVVLSSAIALSLSSSLSNDIDSQLDKVHAKNIVFENVIKNWENQEDEPLIVIIDESKPEELENIEDTPGDIEETEDAAIDIKEIEDPELVVDEPLVEQVVEEVPEEIKVSNISNYDKAMLALKENKFLIEEEKQLFLANFNIVEDNLEYMNFDKLLNTLNTVKIEYISEPNEDLSIAGTYTSMENVIRIYNCDSYIFANPTVLSHEFCHALQFTNGIEGRNYSWLVEGCNALFNDEYYGKEYAYVFERNLVYSLMEILGSEPVRKTNFTTNADYIIDALKELNVKENEIYEFLVDADVVHRNNSFTQEEVKESSLYVNNFLKNLYEIKYNRKIEDDLIMIQYLDNERFCKSIVDLYDLEVDDELVNSSISCLQRKYYFNKKFLNQNIILSSPKSNRIVKYDIKTLEEVMQDGNAYIDEDGSVILNAFLSIDENNMVYRTKLEESEEKVIVEINDTNRYLNNGFVR